MILGVILCLQYCVLGLAGYTGTDLVGQDSLVGKNDFESENSDWTLKNFKIIDIKDSMENIDNIPGEGHIAVPQMSMSGNDMGEMSIMLSIHVRSRVAVVFSVYVSRFDPADNSSFSHNPALEVSLVEMTKDTKELLTSLERLNPENNAWNNRRTEVETGGSLEKYKLSLSASMGSGAIALDGLSVEIWPLVNSIQHSVNKTETHKNENKTETNNGGDDSTTTTTTKTSNIQVEDNSTKTSSSNASTNISEEPAMDTTLSAEATHNNIVTESSIAANMSTLSSNMTTSPLTSADTSMYGYTG